jgi:aminoglycoside 6'-N-acetyltransferase
LTAQDGERGAQLTELRGERVVIVPAGSEHAERLRELRAHPEVARWWGPPPRDWPLGPEPDVERFAIVAGAELVGAIQFWEETDPGSRYADVDIFIGRESQGLGLGTEAMRLIVHHLVEDRGHHRVTLSTAVDNARAIHVYEKVGFRPVGVTRKSSLNELSGEWEDELLMEYVV